MSPGDVGGPYEGDGALADALVWHAIGMAAIIPHHKDSGRNTAMIWGK